MLESGKLIQHPDLNPDQYQNITDLSLSCSLPIYQQNYMKIYRVILFALHRQTKKGKTLPPSAEVIKIASVYLQHVIDKLDSYMQQHTHTHIFI